jgi:hypothetical protein
MTELSLKQCGRRRDDPYDVIAGGAVIGRIMYFSATPSELPWAWTIAPGYQEGRSTTHGHARGENTRPTWRSNALRCHFS